MEVTGESRREEGRKGTEWRKIYGSIKNYFKKKKERIDLFWLTFERTFNQGVVVTVLQLNRGTDGHISNMVKKQRNEC